MKNIIASLLLSIASITTIYAQHYVPVDDGSKVEFKIINNMLGKHEVTGTFKDLKGTITFNPKELGSAAFDVTVSVNSIHTGIGLRDNDLKKEKFFNQEKYPEIRIRSTKVEAGKAPNTYILHGNLTMKGIAMPVEISFIATPAKDGYIFKGQLKVNRMQFKVGEQGKIDEVATVDLEVHAKKS